MARRPIRFYIVRHVDDARSGLDLIAVLHFDGEAITDMNVIKTEPEITDQ
jgi:hypothetical protein